MTRQMAADHARDSIRFNALCAGFVDTPFNAIWLALVIDCGEVL